MKTNTFKSITAILLGLVAVFIVSIATDVVLDKMGIMKMEPFNANSTGIIWLVIAYRSVYNTLGCYLAAKLAPNKPMKHAMILGGIGMALCIVGLVAMWEVPPHWYPATLIVLALPCAWLGGKLYINSQ